MGDGSERWRKELAESVRLQAEILADLRYNEAAADIERKCESPIEKLFAAQLVRIAPLEQDFCLIRGQDAEEFDFVHLEFVQQRGMYASAHNPRPVVAWYPQCQIDNFRVDFLLMGWVEGMKESLIPRTVVECDGFEFHERTKEQAIRDRRRDRELQERGFRVFRFLGSEIWKDAEKCAKSVLDNVGGSLLYHQLSEHSWKHEAGWNEGGYE